MIAQHAEVRSVVDLAIQGLQEERAACVLRLNDLLTRAEQHMEAQGYLRRIENVNNALVRLAGSHIVH